MSLTSETVPLTDVPFGNAVSLDVALKAFRPKDGSPKGRVLTDVKELLAQLRVRQADVPAISNAPTLLRQASCGFAFPREVPEWLAPLVAIVPAQLLALHLCRAKGLPIDNPRGLTKVTHTR